jgi:endo-1,4-beta-xylanase
MKRVKCALGLLAGLSLLAFSCQSTAPAKTETAKASPAAAEKPTGNMANVKAGTPVIDGTMDDMWKACDVLKTESKVMGDSGAYAEVRLLWDADYLYVLADVKDAKLSDSNPNAWEQDSVEIMLDQNNGKTKSYQADDAQYRVSIKNKVSGTNTSSKMNSAVSVTATGYIVEAALPLSKVKGAEGVVMGFDIQVNDDNGGGARTSIRAWNDSSNTAYQNTSVFGTITFVK